MAHFEHVFFRYDSEDWVLNDLTFTIHEGEWIVVLGPNGSGKSTMARLLNGLHLPTQGTVRVNEKFTEDDHDIVAIRRNVGMVFQNPDHQFVAPTVRDDVAFGMENAGIDRAEMIERIDWVAREVGIEPLLDIEPHRLSGGQKQRVAIAGILALQPKMMIFDEATSMLDPKGRHEVIQTIQKLQKDHQLSIVTISHHLHESLVADRVVYMEEGQILKDLDTCTFLQELDWFKERGFPLPYSFELYLEMSLRHIENPWEDWFYPLLAESKSST